MIERHDIMEQVNELIKIVNGFIPLFDEKSSDPTQKYALSRMYADKGFRDYIIRAIATNKNSLGDVSDLQGLWLCKGRIEVLSELLGISKKLYEESAKLDKILK